MATMTLLSMLVILVMAQLLLISYDVVDGLSMPPSKTSISSSSLISTSDNNNSSNSRRQVIGSLLGGGTAALIGATTATTGSIANANTMDTESFLQSGGVAMPMGVSGQAVSFSWDSFIALICSPGFILLTIVPLFIKINNKK